MPFSESMPFPEGMPFPESMPFPEGMPFPESMPFPAVRRRGSSLFFHHKSTESVQIPCFYFLQRRLFFKPPSETFFCRKRTENHRLKMTGFLAESD